MSKTVVSYLRGSHSSPVITMANSGTAFPRACFICSREPALACGRCRTDFYCSQTCQKVDWSRHRLFCRVRGEPNAEPLPLAKVTKWDVNDATLSPPAEHKQTKEELLKRAREDGIGRLQPVYCDHDPVWVLRLLKAAAPLLEELDLWNAMPQHWLLLAQMKRLLRLEVNFWFPVLIGEGAHGPLELPALPPVDPAAGPSRLLWLRCCLPRNAALDLVGRHGPTLRELQLFVGTSGKAPKKQGERGWPWSCGAEELASLLQQCNLTSLRSLVLRRPGETVFSLCGSFTHQRPQCRQQLDAVRAVLPKAQQVLCGTCDNVIWKCFEKTLFGVY